MVYCYTVIYLNNVSVLKKVQPGSDHVPTGLPKTNYLSTYQPSACCMLSVIYYQNFLVWNGVNNWR